MFPALQISMITFLIASLQNYILNHFWTFTKTMDAEPPKILNYFRFLFEAMIGLFINLILSTFTCQYIALTKKDARLLNEK